MNLLALEFPPISHIVEWPAFSWSPDGMFAINKVVVLMFLSVALTLLIFGLAASKAQLVPTGIQSIAESSVEFVRDQIVMQTMGEHGLHKKWVMPLLMALFWFILFNNVWGIIPVAQMPVNARMAMPALLALVVWVVYNTVGSPYFEAGCKAMAVKGRQIFIATIDRAVPFDIFQFYRGRHAFFGIDSLALGAAECAATLRALAPGFESGALKPFPVGKSYEPARAHEAYRAVLQGARERIVLTP